MGNHKTSSDAELLRLLRSGQEGVFEEIYERYHRNVHSLLKKYLRSAQLAEDVCQNVFAKFWEQREQPLIIREIGAWLFTIAKRQALDVLRRASVEQVVMASVMQEYPLDRNLEEDHIAKDYYQFIKKQLNNLPEQTRAVFQLCRQQHHTYDEAGELLGISRNTVKKHMVRAMKVLKDAAEDELGISLTTLFILMSIK